MPYFLLELVVFLLVAPPAILVLAFIAVLSDYLSAGGRAGTTIGSNIDHEHEPAYRSAMRGAFESK